MISALMPVRNGAATLDIALESLRTQTLPLRQCVVVDDGSTDSTPQLLEQWRQRLPGLRVLRTPGVGISKALNAGLALCETDWIARMDADDRAHPTRFQNQLAAASNSNVALIGCEVRHWVAGDESAFQGMRRHIDWANSLHTHDELARAVWIDSPLPHPSWLVHRRAFEAIGAYSEKEDVPEDYEWLHRFFSMARTRNDLRAVKVSGGALLDWAESTGRLTRTSPAYSAEAFNAVKARALQDLVDREGAAPRPIFILGLGPKSKALFSPLRENLRSIRAVVEVNTRRIGNTYEDVEIWGIERWQAALTADNPFTVICLGTPEARLPAEQLCQSLGLRALEQFISL